MTTSAWWPALDAATLELCFGLALESVAMAMIVMCVTVVVSVPLAACASVRVLAGTRWPARIFLVHMVRGLLDLLRGVPDFVWAVLWLALTGPGTLTGMLALAMYGTGVLARIFADLWDECPRHAEAHLQLVGAGPLVRLFYLYLPATWPAMCAHMGLRLECTLRNATVIGVVGGGGLGARLFEEFEYAHYDRVASLLLTLIGLSAAFEYFVRLRLKPGANGLGRRPWLVVLLVLGVSASFLGGQLTSAIAELTVAETDYFIRQIAALLEFDFSWPTLLDAVQGLGLPLGLALTANLVAGGTALVLAYLGNPKLMLRGVAEPASTLHWAAQACAVSVRAAALLGRAVPEVALALAFAVLFGMGPVAALWAMIVHSVGSLSRVCFELVLSCRIDAVAGPSFVAYVYSTWPRIWPQVRRHLALSVEASLRAGLVLGVVGAGGIGDAFHSSFVHWNLGRAGTLLLTMVLMTSVVDRGLRRWFLRKSPAQAR